MTESLRDQMLKLGLISKPESQEVDWHEGSCRDPHMVKDLRNLSGEAKDRALEQWAIKSRVDGRRDGGRRYYFESRDGRIPFLELSDEAVKHLAKGEWKVIQSSAGKTWLVKKDIAKSIASVDPAWVRSSS